MSKRKTNLSLVDYAISRLGTGYVYGTYGHVLTESLLVGKIRQYPLKVKPHESFIRSNWMGKPVQDCVGLVKGHYWTDDDGKIVYKLDNIPDVSANGLYNAAKEKGKISTLTEIKGLIVWKKGHVGVYIGGGEVIEAHGTESGVVKTKLTKAVNETKWTNWCKCPYIDYLEERQDEYVVKAGDTLWTLANRFLGNGNKFIEIARINNILPPYTIYAGQVIRLAMADFESYVVRDGDSLWSIAKKLLRDGQKYKKIAVLNGISDPYLIHTGQILKIPKGK